MERGMKQQCDECRGSGQVWLDTGWHRGHGTGMWLDCRICDGRGTVERPAPKSMRIEEPAARMRAQLAALKGQ